MKLCCGEIISKIGWSGVCNGGLLDYDAFCEDWFASAIVDGAYCILGCLSTVGTAGVIDEPHVADGKNEGNGRAKID